MSLNLKTANLNDIEDLISMRLEFSLMMHPTKDENEINKLRTELKKYFENELRETRYIGILGYLGNVLVCAAGLIVYEMPPIVENYKRKTGHIVNVITKTEFRKKGFGKETIELLIKIAETEGIKKLCLNATLEGESVYRKLGFTEDRYKALVLEI